MADVEHKDLVAGEVHVLPQWVYADSTARLAATGFAAGDVTKVAYQQSDSSFWVLTDDSPIVWKEIGGYIPGGTDVAVADGGTAASTASGARTNLGLVIGTNVQAWDADLDTWATKTAPSGTPVGTTDAQTLTNKTLTAPTIADFTNAGHDHLDADDGGTLSAAAIASGTIATARLGSGTADNTTFLRGDQTWATPSGSGIAELDDIPDVNAPSPANGDVLTWDSTPGEWVATSPGALTADLDDLGDVNAPTPANGDVLTWDSTPGEWVAAAPTGGGGGSTLIIEELDGSPTDSVATTLKVPNTTLAIASHVATLTVAPMLPLDRPPTSAHASDDEFDGSSLDGKWADVYASQTLAATVANHWLTIEPSTSGASNTAKHFFGIRQAAPAGSFTVMGKLADTGSKTSNPSSGTDDCRCGIFVARTSDGKFRIAGDHRPAGHPLDLIAASNYSESADMGAYDGVFNTFITNTIVTTVWVKIAWDSSASTLTYYYSFDGVGWVWYTSQSSQAQPNRIGIGMYSNSAALLADHVASFDWFRVTEP